MAICGGPSAGTFSAFGNMAGAMVAPLTARPRGSSISRCTPSRASPLASSGSSSCRRHWIVSPAGGSPRLSRQVARLRWRGDADREDDFLRQGRQQHVDGLSRGCGRPLRRTSDDRVGLCGGHVAGRGAGADGLPGGYSVVANLRDNEVPRKRYIGFRRWLYALRSCLRRGGDSLEWPFGRPGRFRNAGRGGKPPCRMTTVMAISTRDPATGG